MCIRIETNVCLLLLPDGSDQHCMLSLQFQHMRVQDSSIIYLLWACKEHLHRLSMFWSVHDKSQSQSNSIFQLTWITFAHAQWIRILSVRTWRYSAMRIAKRWWCRYTNRSTKASGVRRLYLQCSVSLIYAFCNSCRQTKPVCLLCIGQRNADIVVSNSIQHSQSSRHIHESICIVAIQETFTERSSLAHRIHQ